MKKTILNKRQDLILQFLEESESAGISQLIGTIVKELEKVSKMTVNRDIKELIKINYIKSIGAGRSLKYQLSERYKIIKPVEMNKYFQKAKGERGAKKGFNFDVFGSLQPIFTKEELDLLEELNKAYKKRLKTLSSGIIKREFERLTIDLSWKSSRIEGNTYSLLETEQLIVEHKEAEGHSKKEAAMILNHKKALDFIRSNLEKFKELNVKKIEEIHSILVENLDISKNIRRSLVGITGTNYRPIGNEFQIKESLERVCDLSNKAKNGFEKAIVIMLLIAYIQPFEDGNKRTSRLVGNAVLLSNKACPLSYGSIDEGEYKKAVLLFYEQNNVSNFKRLFMEQYEFATREYFL